MEKPPVQQLLQMQRTTLLRVYFLTGRLKEIHILPDPLKKNDNPKTISIRYLIEKKKCARLFATYVLFVSYFPEI